jgi:Hint module
MPCKIGSLAATVYFVIVAAWLRPTEGVADRLISREDRAARLQTRFHRPSDELTRALNAAARVLSGSRSAAGAIPRIARMDGECFPSKEQMQSCYKTCSTFQCADDACTTQTTTCGDAGCCRTAVANGTRLVMTECYKGCCFAVDHAMNFVAPTPCVNGQKGGLSRAAAQTSKKNCFPAAANVELESGMARRMDELRVGDKVKVAPGVFSDVFMFTHKLREASADFVVISTESGHTVRLTAGHYIHANGALVPAGIIKVGDKLTLSSGAGSAVVSLSWTVEAGLFNPQTLHGDIVVDGIVASTYTTAVPAPVGHAWLAPLRSMYNRFGMVTRAFENGADGFSGAAHDLLKPLGRAAAHLI